MGLFKNFAAAVLKSLSPSVQAFLKGDEVIANGAAMVNGYEQSTWVYAAVTALAKNVSQIPFRISEGAEHDENLVASGAVVELFKQPHQFLDRFQFWELLVTWLMIRGEAFVVALDAQGRVISARDGGPSTGSGQAPSTPSRGSGQAGSGRTRIAQMLILSPDRFWHVIENGTLQGWRYSGMNYNDPPMESQVFLPEEVMQLRLPNPFLFWRGLSPLSVAMLAASTDYASAQFMKGLMLNNADTGVIVTTDQQASDEQKEQILAALRARKRMAGTADRPLFLWGGAKVEKPTVTSADMQFLENRKLNRLEIGAVFGVPATVIGFSEDANRAVAGQERLNFVQQTILPLCARLEAFIEPVVKLFGPEFRGCFHSENLPIMQEARRARGQAAMQFFGMGVPLNDINRVFDLGLPEYAWGNTGYLPRNLQAVGTAPFAPGEKSGPLPAVERMLQICKKCGVRNAECGVEGKEVVAKAGSRGDLDGGGALAMREFQKAVAAVAASVVSRSEISEETVAAACDCRPNEGCEKGDSHGSRPAPQRNAVLTRRPETAATVSSDKAMGRMGQIGPMGHTAADDGGEVSAKCEADVADAVKRFKGRLAKLFFEQRGRVLEKMSRLATVRNAFTAEVLDSLFDVEAEDEVLLAKVRPLLTANFELDGGSKLAELNGTTRDALLTSLGTGLANGDSHEKLVRRAKDVFQTAADERAGSIALEEVNSAAKAGRIIGMRQAHAAPTELGGK